MTKHVVDGIFGTGIAGYSLGKLIYASTPEERVSALMTLAPSAYTVFCAGLIDLVTWRVKKDKIRPENRLEEIIEQIN